MKKSYSPFLHMKIFCFVSSSIFFKSSVSQSYLSNQTSSCNNLISLKPLSFASTCLTKSIACRSSNDDFQYLTSSKCCAPSNSIITDFSLIQKSNRRSLPLFTPLHQSAVNSLVNVG